MNQKDEDRFVLASRKASMTLIQLHAESELSTLTKLESVMDERDAVREKMLRIEKLVESWSSDDSRFEVVNQLLHIIDEGE